MTFSKKRITAVLVALIALIGLAALLPLCVKKADGLAQFDEICYEETYGVGYSFTIYSSKALLDGEEVPTSAVLMFGGEAVASLSQGEQSVKYRLGKAGAYTLSYVAEKNGKRYVKSYSFSAVDAPYFSENIEPKYKLGEMVELDAFAFFGAENKSVVGTLFKGGARVSNGESSFVVRETGDYTVLFSARFGEETYTFSRHFSVGVNGYEDLFIVTDGKASFEPNASAPEHITAGKGLKIFTGPSTVLRFSNVIDLNEIGSDENFIKFVPLTGDGYQNISDVIITFTDVYDENNKLSVKFGSAPNSSLPYVYVSYNGPYMGINDETSSNFYNTVQNVYATGILDAAFTKRDGRNAWMRGLIDYAQRRFYTYKFARDAKPVLVLDADDPSLVGFGSEWEGFTTGEVYADISVDGKENAGIILAEFAGQSFAGETVTDTGAPSFVLDYASESMPTGVVGKPYRLPQVRKVLDLIEGEIPAEKVSVQLSQLFGEKIIDESGKISGGSFIPAEAGEYRAEYYVSDGSGNSAVKSVRFTVVTDIGTPSAELITPDRLYVGNYYKLPDVDFSGVSAITEKTVSYSYNGKTLAGVVGDEVFLSEKGKIEIDYRAEDYVGNVLSGTRLIDVAVSPLPVLNVNGVPYTAIKGRTLYLPDFTAYDYNYSESESGYRPARSITVNGKPLDMTARKYEVTESAGSVLNVVFAAGGATVEKQVRVIEPEFIGDYFIKESDSAVTAENKADGLGLGFSDDLTVTPVNAMYVADAYGFTLKFSADKANFGKLDLILVDFADESKYVYFSVDASDGCAQINGKGNKAPVLSNGAYTLTYNNMKKRLDDCGVITEFADGRKFTGFSGGLCKIVIRASEVTGDSYITLLTLGNQTLSTSYSGDSPLPYTDGGVPTLVYDAGKINRNVRKGEKLTVPSALGQTFLSGSVSVDVSLYNPSGRAVISGVSAFNDLYYEIDSYGYWSIEYTVRYGNGAFNDISVAVHVKNPTPPALDFADGAIPSTVKLNDKLIIPEPLSTDGNNVYYVTVCNAIGKYRVVKFGDEITFDSEGTWSILYNASDSFNTNVKIFYVTVRK